MMKPTFGGQGPTPRSRKASLSDPAIPPSTDSARNPSPVTYFLRRGSQETTAAPTPPSQGGAGERPEEFLVQTLAQATGNAPSALATRSSSETDDISPSPRRRSTLKPKPKPKDASPSPSAKAHPAPQEPLTPLLMPSDGSSFPSSPKSTSTRSLRPSDIGSVDDDPTQMRAEEESMVSPDLYRPDAPVLIMPSIKMPSRRPFTSKGKGMSNFKILIAGRTGR